jgi:hypothetical protein
VLYYQHRRFKPYTHWAAAEGGKKRTDKEEMAENKYNKRLKIETEEQ